MAHRSRRCVSVRHVIYSHLINLAFERRLSVCGLIHTIAAAELERAGMAGGLPAPRLAQFDASRTVQPGPVRRRSVSLSAAVGKRFDQLASSREMQVTTLLDDLCCDELARVGITVQRVKTPSREYKHEGRPPRQVDDRCFGGYQEFGPGSVVAGARIVEPRVIVGARR